MKTFDGKLICGRSSSDLAEAIGQDLSTFTTYKRPKVHGQNRSVPFAADAFPDGEPKIEIPMNVRDADVFIVNSTQQPGNNLMELLTMVHAARLASAGTVTAVIPYFGYARQDRKVKPRTPITAALVCQLLEAAGVDRVLTTDLHAGQIQGMLRRPFDNLEGMPLILRDVRRDFGLDLSEVAMVSPDDGGVARCRETGKRAKCLRITFCLKSHVDDGSTVVHEIRDPRVVEGRTVILIDDMADTCGSLANAAVALQQAGAQRIIAAVIHPLLSRRDGGMTAQQRIVESPIDRFYVSDTVPLDPELAKTPGFMEKTRVVTMAPLFAGAIAEIHTHGSVSGIFERTCEKIFED